MDQALFHMASPAGLAAGGTTSVNLLAPAMILVNLPAMLLFSWVAGRLLGVRRRSWLGVLVCGFTGYLAGGSLALLVAHGDATAPGATRNAWIFGVVFTMAATAGFELLVRPRPHLATAAVPVSVPHPVRSIRRSARRGRRYLQIIRIALGHGLGPYLGFGRGGRGADRAASPARRVRLALEEAGGMFVKLGQMLSTRPDVVSPAMAQELTRLQEHVSPADPEAVRALAGRRPGGGGGPRRIPGVVPRARRRRH
jgi:ubiquinone biosynthesis protein